MEPKIENLVLPACSQNLFILFGAVFLLKNKFWNITDLKLFMDVQLVLLLLFLYY